MQQLAWNRCFAMVQLPLYQCGYGVRRLWTWSCFFGSACIWLAQALDRSSGQPIHIRPDPAYGLIELDLPAGLDDEVVNSACKELGVPSEGTLEQKKKARCYAY